MPIIEGARNALLGYLYQLVGTASVVVREVASGDDLWAELVAKVQEGVVRVEEFGQDATTRPLGLPDQGVVAIQFKYSAAANNPIKPNELIDILFVFDRSRRAAAALGETIDQYVLITNRRLKASTQHLVEQDRSNSNSGPPRALRLRSRTQKGKVLEDNVGRLEPYGGNGDAAALEIDKVRRALEVLPCTSFEADLARLQAFAARYGVLETEWPIRLNALIGALVSETAEGRIVNLTREWLKQHLIGDSLAANLEFGSSYAPHISNLCCRQVESRLENHHRIWDHRYVGREVEQQISDRLATCSVVFVYGTGGCGKSLAVAQFLRSLSATQIVCSHPAMTAAEETAVTALNAMRLPKGSCAADRKLSDFRKRLDVANPGKKIAWTIDLDGVDEAPERRAELVNLIHLCWAEGNQERSPASLIVTCRSPEAGDHSPRQLLNEWIGAPDGDLVRGIGFVPLGEFTIQELAAAAQRLNGQPEKRILDVLASATAQLHRPFHGTGSVSAAILEALRHPVVWGGYATLCEKDRTGILNEVPDSLDRLATLLFQRFLVRCWARRTWSDRSIFDDAFPDAALSLVGPPPYSIGDWEKAFQPYLGSAEARYLYHESLTYGLVRRDARVGWRWGHQFVVDYLIRQSQKETE